MPVSRRKKHLKLLPALLSILLALALSACGSSGSSLSAKKEAPTGPMILTIPGVKNARDLGGVITSGDKKIKQGMAFRSAQLDDLTDEGAAIILDDLGVKTELDLRNRAVEEIISPLSDRLNHINVPLLSYEAFLKYPKSTKEAARVFTIPDNYPILFHCVAGADRTGCLAFLLGALCGASEEELITDYELTENRSRNGVEEDGYFLDFPAFLELFRSFPGETFEEKAHWFLSDQCKLSDMEIYNIKALLTGEAAVFVEPPKSAVKTTDGRAVFEIDSRSSGEVKKVSADGKQYDFTFENGLLTIETADTAETAAVVTFADGTEMPVMWKS